MGGLLPIQKKWARYFQSYEPGVLWGFPRYVYVWKGYDLINTLLKILLSLETKSIVCDDLSTWPKDPAVPIQP